MKSFSILILIFIPLLAFSQGDSLTIKYNYISSIPQNAEVYLDDTLAGFTPYRFSPELHPLKVTLKLPGYKESDFIPDSYPFNKTILLFPVNGKRLPPFVEENKSTEFKAKRKIVPVILFSALTAGAVVSSYYFKKLANDNYDEYVSNHNQSSLDKTKKYDLISGISIGFFQAGLAGLLYYLFIK